MEPQHPWTDDELIARSISYRGHGLAVSWTPFVPDAETLALLRRRVEAVSAAAELAVAAFERDAAVRALYGYGALQETCILCDPGYRPLIPLGRWDSFLFPEGPRFMEYNTDGAAGWHYTAELTALWREEEGLPPESEPLPARLLKTLLTCFRRWDKKGVERPRIALVDWAEVGTRAEQQALAERFTALGYPTALEDPRSLRAEGGRLTGARGTYDVVYRRLVSEEAFRRAEEIRPFLDAFLEGAACFVGSFRTDPAWSKTLFVLLSDPAFAYLWPEALRPDLEASIPWTRIVQAGPATYLGETLDLEELLLSRREAFILKPARSYEGQGIHSGAFCTPEVWAKAVADALAHGDSIVQEMLRPEPNGSLGGRFIQPGEYVLLGRLAGFLARSSATPLITPDLPERYHPVGVEVPWIPPPDPGGL